MIISEKIERVKLLSNNSINNEYSDEILTEFLKLAETEIMSRIYNDITGHNELPTIYENLQCMSVIVGINQIGAEGGKSYSSSGLSRDFAYETVINYIRSNLPSKVRVI